MSDIDPRVIQYYSDKKVIVVESSVGIANSIIKTISELGFKKDNISMVHSFEMAKTAMLEKQPEVIISEYKINNSYGLDLIDVQTEYIKDPSDKVFLLVTGNASDTAVAEAAEEEVDGYIIKPFAPQKLQSALAESGIRKLNPPKSYQLILEGRAMLAEKEYETALDKFEEAITHSEKPALAYYYKGMTQSSQGFEREAVVSFKEGLKTFPLHYKCLVGLFESLDQLGKIKDAYKVIQTIGQHFPVTPQRLGKMILLAVYTHHYTDVDKYYQKYVELDRKSDDLTKIVTAGMLACGKFQIKKGLVKEGFESIKKGLISNGRSAAYGSRGARAFYDVKKYDFSKEMLNLVKPEERKEPIYLKMLLFHDFIDQEPSRIVELGRMAISDGYADEEIFAKVIDAYMTLGKGVAAENLVDQACSLFPKRSSFFRGLLKSAS